MDGFYDTVVVCTDLCGKEPYKQVGVGSMVTLGSLGGEIVSTLIQNARDVGSIPALGTIFALPGCWTYPVFACMYVIVGIKTYNSRWMSVVVCTELPGKEPHKHVGVGSMVVTGSLGPACMRCGFDDHSRHIISHFHHTHDNALHPRNIVKPFWNLSQIWTHISMASKIHPILYYLKEILQD